MKNQYKVTADGIETFYISALSLQDAQKEAVNEIYKRNNDFDFLDDIHEVSRVQNYELLVDGEVIVKEEVEFDDADEFDNSAALEVFEGAIKDCLNLRDNEYEKLYYAFEPGEDGWTINKDGHVIEIRRA